MHRTCIGIILIVSSLVQSSVLEGLEDDVAAAAPTVHGHQSVCQDTIQHCHDMPQEECLTYYDFMASHCAKYCGLCEATTQAAATQAPTTVAVSPLTTASVSVCGDVLANCTSYPTDNCCGIYEPWARAHCASYCGFCGTPPQRLCEDKVDYCSREPRDLCTNENYVIWRNLNCAGFCKLCDAPWEPPYCAEYLYREFVNATQQPTPALGDTTVNPCVDALDNCTSVPPENCCGPYEPWSRARCARYCGFCGVVPDRVCTDRVDYCDRLPSDLCTNLAYIVFKKTNCAGTCRICDTPWKPPSCTAHLFEGLMTSAQPIVG